MMNQLLVTEKDYQVAYNQLCTRIKNLEDAAATIQRELISVYRQAWELKTESPYTLREPRREY